ncbi:MAG: hypothetical protein M0Z65_08670 [Firmicutes bacterium]|uniref:Coat F domain-containing protein n=1 Tax=Melghirimyces thermohalophilus TaxID=1236220 RepID=A0A1G6KTJ9_9BACL|nr:hypothetical protein [Melghirimyces thermohalophilus]MDA8353237.1 hypothetical protein [Bacillota bacterium]SDC34400.1 hypothetical protein SAMN04488112_106157 [Melghirimyces thermohalophilus]
MEQLTQMELLHLQDLISAEALAVRKYNMYESHCDSQEMKKWCRDAADLHSRRMERIMEQLRLHDGREPRDAERKH